MGHPSTTTTATMSEKNQPKAAEATPAEPKIARVRAIHGLMVHPFNSKHIDTDSEAKIEIDSWVQIQIDAGKLEIIKD